MLEQIKIEMDKLMNAEEMQAKVKETTLKLLGETNENNCGFYHYPLLTWGHTNLHYQMCYTLKSRLIEFGKQRDKAKVKIKHSEPLPTPKRLKVKAAKLVSSMS